MAVASHGRGGHGAYGLRLTGVDTAALVPVPLTAPTVGVVNRRPAGVGPDRGVSLGRDVATLRLPAGWIEVRRHPLRVYYATPEPLSGPAIVHPYLAFPAAVISAWLSRPAFHAGAVGIGDHALAVMGNKGSGKSTMVAALARAGCSVLADDLIVLAGGEVQPGPRAIDLRPDMAPLFDTDDLGTIGARPRHRATPAGAAPRQLGAIVHLGWGDRVALERLEPGERMRGLVANAALGPASVHESACLDLIGIPTYRLVRPRRPDSVIESARSLLRMLDRAC